MIQLKNIKKSFGNRVLFESLDLNMGPRERLGLLGRNGQGKSVLLKIIANQMSADSGQMVVPKNYTIGYLQQHLHFSQENITKELLSVLPKEEQEDDYKANKILTGLGFSVDDLQRPASAFSGGYQIRIQLGKVLISAPLCLLLDEPTNFLDIIAKRWFIQYIRKWPGELIVISHERDFLDSIVTHSAFLTSEGTIYKVQGNSSKLFEQMELDLNIQEKTRANQEKKIKQTQLFIDRFRSKSSKATLVQSRIKALDRMEKVSATTQSKTLDFMFNYSPISAQVLLKLKNLSFGYTKDKFLFQNIQFELKKSQIIGIIGRNGKGKSTLLNCIAKELNLISGTMDFHSLAEVGFFGQTNIDRLKPQDTIEEQIASANGSLSKGEVLSLCGSMMFSGDDAQKKISVLSGGERARVLLGKILATSCNILLLDEPTNHLDMESVESLKEAMKAFEGGIILVTHHEELLHELCDALVIFDEENNNGAEFFLGGYQDFLDKIGWREDTSESSPKNAKESKNQREEERKKRTSYIYQRASEIRPIVKKIQELEKKIELLEEKKSQFESNIVDLSMGKIQKIGELSMSELNIKLSSINKELEYLQINWEKCIELQDEIDSKYVDLI